MLLHGSPKDLCQLDVDPTCHTMSPRVAREETSAHTLTILTHWTERRICGAGLLLVGPITGALDLGSE